VIGRRIVLCGSLAQKPELAGHAWFFLNWLLGLGQLDCDVLFIDWLSREMCDGDVPESENARYLDRLMRRYGFGESYSLLDRASGEAVAGASRADVLRRTGESALLINVMGYLDDEEILERAGTTAFLDIDPGFGQMWRELRLADIFDGHDAHITIGENIGQSECSIPRCGIEWIATRQPVVLDLWPTCSRDAHKFTSIGSWRGPFEPIAFQGETYGQRVHEFRKFVTLPSRTGSSFEVALDIDQADSRDRALLESNGWHLRSPAAVVPTPEAYQSYIAGSKAEFSVARGMYVQTRSGWFSDRSVCYLASGRPVLAQDTGLRELYPTGLGLVTFDTLDEAVGAVEEVESDYLGHAHAARQIAEEFFDSRRVLSKLLATLGVE
jgi:hypothetical protein